MTAKKNYLFSTEKLGSERIFSSKKADKEGE
jgi:hypothetical protein